MLSLEIASGLLRLGSGNRSASVGPGSVKDPHEAKDHLGFIVLRWDDADLRHQSNHLTEWRRKTALGALIARIGIVAVFEEVRLRVVMGPNGSPDET